MNDIRGGINAYSLNDLNIISFSDYSSFYSYAAGLAELKKSTVIGYLNAFTFLYYSRNIKYDNFVFIPDGVAMHFALKILFPGKYNHKKRIVSTDLWNGLMNYIKDRGLTCYFYGGSYSDSKSFTENMNSKYPGLKISGLTNGYEELNVSFFKDISVDFLFLGKSTPKQEEWARNNIDKLNIPVIILVGSAIDYWSGVKKRAPVYMQKIGLEWLYRIFKEPGRLWKRYIFGIPFFIFKVIQFKFKLMLKNENT